MAAAAEDGKKGVAEGDFERAPGQAAIGFQGADLSLDSTATSEIGDPTWRQAASWAADGHTSRQDTMTAISTVDDGEARVWPSHGLPGTLRMPTIKPSSRVAAMLTLAPNSVCNFANS